jgi:hypothetical protein
MLTILLAILCSVASACAGRPTETKNSPIPEELVGEWRNSQDPIKFGVIYLLPDGHGMWVGNDKGTAIGAKFVATYDSETHTLTATSLTKPHEGGQPGQHTEQMRYDPDSKTFTIPGDDTPYSRVSLEVHPNIKKQFE